MLRAALAAGDGKSSVAAHDEEITAGVSNVAMSTFEVTLLGLSMSFRTNAGPERVDAARALTEERCNRLAFHGRQLSREKMLTYVSLGLADDLLQSERQVKEMQERLEALLAKIKNSAQGEIAP